MIKELPLKLKVLNLSANRLGSLPSQIFSMVQIEAVNVSYNVLTDWPADDTDYNDC